jgi:hypothetical protein
VDLLKSFFLRGGFSDEKAEQIAQKVTFKNFNKGDFFAEEGKTSKHLGFMLNVRFLSTKFQWFIAGLLVMLTGHRVKARASFAAYKPYLLISRDSFMKFGHTNDGAVAGLVIDSLAEYAIENKNEELEQNTVLLKAGFMGWFPQQGQQRLQIILQVKRWAENNQHDYLLLRVYNMLGLFYYHSKQYDVAFEQYLLIRAMQKIERQAA